MASIVYTYRDEFGRTVTLHPVDTGIRVLATVAGAVIPDDEIPNLVSALQHYMSRRANELTRAANGKR